MQLPVLNLNSPPASELISPQPRSIEAVRVLRISITDRCNLRCLYCMPADGVEWLPNSNILTDEEICRVIRAAVGVHGIRRIKLTGGEPTVRPGLVALVRRIRQIPGITDLSLTTNGILLENLAGPLREAGLNRLTVSLDSLRPDRFRQITRVGDINRVLRGLQAAQEAGFSSVKLNCVVMRDVNSDEVVDFARLTVEQSLTVRFIEYMPLGESSISECGGQDRGPEALFPESEMRLAIETSLGPLQRLSPSSEPGVGPAAVYRLANGNPAGRIGFISAMSRPFCESCNRLRLTADGHLRSCLFDGGEVDVKPILRQTANPDPDELAQAMVRCVAMKPIVHSGRGADPMSRMGG